MTERVANRIIELGLAAPAIFFLEAHKPLAFIGSQLLLMAQPMADILWSKNLIRPTADLLADPAQLEQLITYLEQQAPLAAQIHSRASADNAKSTSEEVRS